MPFFFYRSRGFVLLLHLSNATFNGECKFHGVKQTCYELIIRIRIKNDCEKKLDSRKDGREVLSFHFNFVGFLSRTLSGSIHM